MAKENPEGNGAGVQSGLAEKTPLKNIEKQLSKPDPDESAKQPPRGEKSAGGGFTWK